MIDTAILDELREQTKWLRLLGLQALRPVVEGVLKTDRQRLAFELTDGGRSIRDVAHEAGLGVTTVARWWQEWLTAGICIEVPGKAGRAEQLTSLSRLGIDVPKRDSGDGE